MQEEKYGTRDMSYSAWHRRASTKRFIGDIRANQLAMIDMDITMYNEYADGSKWPVALMELAMDVGQTHKSATVTKNLANMAKLSAFTVLYKLSDEQNPVDSRCKDIESFRVKQIAPETDEEWKIMNPKEYAEFLFELRLFKPIMKEEKVYTGELIRVDDEQPKRMIMTPKGIYRIQIKDSVVKDNKIKSTAVIMEGPYIGFEVVIEQENLTKQEEKENESK